MTRFFYKSADELPTYHLANIVDDHLMEVSHGYAVRNGCLPHRCMYCSTVPLGGEDTMPAFAHLPLLLKPEGNGKLSKRDGDRLGFPVFPLEWHDPQVGRCLFGLPRIGLSARKRSLISWLCWAGIRAMTRN